MRKVLLLFVALFCSIVGYAQLEVVSDSFKTIPGFVNQNTEIYDDDNNVLYAVIKVRTENFSDKQRHQLLFQGNAATFIELEYKQDEIWVYLSSIPATYLKISHPDLGTTEFVLPFDLKPKKGYEMVLVNKSSNDSASGSLTVITRPESGATIALNGTVLNQMTPYTNDMIPAGQYEITVSKDRYKSVTKTVVIKDADNQTIEIEMSAICSAISVTSEPLGATVFIDDKEYGVTPCEVKDIIIGHHVLRVAKEGFITVKKQVILKENVTLKTNVVMVNCPEGALSGLFSIGPNRKIIFSKGNLQYQASTNTWRFAEKQTDMIGEYNKNISPNYNGWIDMFGWGTGNCPTKIVKDDNPPSFAEWGNNPISNGGGAKQWWTLSAEGWEYLVNKRETRSGMRFARAVVDGVNGVILLPDNWDAETYELNGFNKAASYNSNVISLSDWTEKFEANGAVFLPALGKRMEKTVDFIGSYALYWTNAVKTPTSSAAHAFYVKFDYPVKCTSNYYLNGLGVRLVRSADDLIGGGTYTDEVLE